MENGNLIDGTEATTHGEVVAINGQNLRDTVSKNIYGSDRTFRIIALADAIPMSSAAAHFAFNSPGEVDKTTSAPMHWKFRGRIVDLQLRPSPHVFCQDPCDLTTAPPEARGLSAQFQQLHTEFFVATDVSQQIKKHDEVIVSLAKGTPYEYDLQWSFCDNPSIRSHSPEEPGKTVACQNMSSLDFSKIAPPANSVATPPTGGGVQYLSGLTLFQHHLDFMTALRSKIDSADPLFPNLIVTSATRTPDKQASIMFDVIRKSGEAEFKRLYRSQGTPVLDKFMVAYQTGNLGAGTNVVNEQIAAGSYFSSHLKSEALDLNTNHLTDKQVADLRRTLGNLGVTSQLLEPLSDCWVGETRQAASSGAVTPGQNNCTREHIHLKIPSKYLNATT